MNHIYHYNMHAEQRYFLGKPCHELYDMIALNGNIVSHTPAGVAAFIATTGKAFYIDPQTHAFQHSTINLKRNVGSKEKGEPPEYEFKPSIRNLACKRLGRPFDSVIQDDRPLSPNDFLDDDGEADNKMIDAVSMSVVEFQQNILRESLDDEAREFLDEHTEFRPAFILAPYFYLTASRFRDWFKITRECYKRTRELTTSQVFLKLVIPKDVLLDEELREEIILGVSAIKPNGILLWIDDYVEEEVGKYQLDVYVTFLKKLRNLVSEIYNSHGGYFSLLLSHEDAGNLLNGIGHSINYGEHRNVIPVGGGIPMARFYFPSIHSRLRFGDALSIVNGKKWLQSQEYYIKYVCDCRQCNQLFEECDSMDDVFAFYGDSYPVTYPRRSGTIVRLEYPTKEAKEAAAYHYLYNKANEYCGISKESLKILIEDLGETYNNISSVSDEKVAFHLTRWKDVLSRLIKK